MDGQATTEKPEGQLSGGLLKQANPAGITAEASFSCSSSLVVLAFPNTTTCRRGMQPAVSHRIGQ